jgi:hypothetical protein
MAATAGEGKGCPWFEHYQEAGLGVGRGHAARPIITLAAVHTPCHRSREDSSRILPKLLVLSSDSSDSFHHLSPRLARLSELGQNRA